MSDSVQLDPLGELLVVAGRLVASGLSPELAIHGAAVAVGMRVLEAGSARVDGGEVRIEGWRFDAREWYRRRMAG